MACRHVCEAGGLDAIPAISVQHGAATRTFQRVRVEVAPALFSVARAARGATLTSTERTAMEITHARLGRNRLFAGTDARRYALRTLRLYRASPAERGSGAHAIEAQQHD